MRLSFVVLLVTALGVVSGAAAQGPAYFGADQYGKAIKSRTQSSIDQGVLEKLMDPDDDNFERIYGFGESDSLRGLSKPVGIFEYRLKSDPQRMATCTATLIAEDLIITNSHCNRDISEALVRFGYLDGLRAAGERFEVSLPAIENNVDLDFAIFRVDGQPGKTYGSKVLDAIDGQSLHSAIIFHHPAGAPLTVSRFKCKLADPASRDQDVMHFCDTLPGSSGSLVLDGFGQKIYGLHYAGSTTEPYNLAKSFRAIMAQSPTLRRLTRPAELGLCRDESHGIESWGVEDTVKRQSNWRGGGNSQPGWCSEMMSRIRSERPGPIDIELLGSDEQSRSTCEPFNCPQYKYSCTVRVRQNPVYKEARSPSCK